MTPVPSRERDSSSRSDGAGARKLAYAAFVRRALAGARTTRAWNGSDVSRHTGVSRQTINRWVRGDWANDPEPDRVISFCTGLGLDPSEAFALLGWAEAAAEPAGGTEVAELDPDIAALARRL